MDVWVRREKRRNARVAGRFEVRVRQRIATWVALTEDVSPRGCRIAVARPVRLGALLELTFGLGPECDPLIVYGQVAWVHRAPPRHVGVTFLCYPRQPRQAEPRVTRWFDRLEARSQG